MYAYSYDTETGGLLLNASPLRMSNEPRPVYYQELDILGFNKFWNYDKDDTYPLMWAEANNYYYRGRLVAKTNGGSVYTAPEIEIIEAPEAEGKKLLFVDIPAMVERNKDIIEKLAQDTIKRIYNTYVEYKNKVDIFYVAFSGGKDSIVTLDLVQKALPHNSFKVIFGDTEMEFPDTYKNIERTKAFCQCHSIDFIHTKSKYRPTESWSKFGPPATVNRWCCNVHKTVPQILAIRKLMNKVDFSGIAFIGVRASESLSRSKYEFLSKGEKHTNQYSCNPILEWNSAELYGYVFSCGLDVGEAYKKGNRRVGCLVCPRAAERNEYLARVCYPIEFEQLLDIVKNMYREQFTSDIKMNEFIKNGGWKARKNGRDIAIDLNLNETVVENIACISISNPKTDWRVWIKTIGILHNDSTPYILLHGGNQYKLEITENADSLEIKYDATLIKSAPKFVKLLRSMARKVACCVCCQECEVNCEHGYITMQGNKVQISNDCLHCSKCHDIPDGCLVYKSINIPRGDFKMSVNKSLNCYSHHAPKLEWFEQYFSLKNEFSQKHTLGSQMFSFFKRFLRDADLLSVEGFTVFAEIAKKIGLQDNASWGLMLSNLVYTPQVNWLVKKVKFGEVYSKDYTILQLVEDGADEKWVSDVWSSIGRLLELPFSNVGLGCAVKEKNRFVSFCRSSWQNPDPRVILYSLYKFAEACGDYYQFTLSRLLDHDIDADGVSPTEIFGIDRDTIQKIVNGLSVNYPEFISASFTLNLENITLNSEKSSKDVLELF